MSRRSGTTLIELVVALPLLALLGAVAVLLLLQTHRVARQADGIVANNRELRHALAALSSDIRPLRGIDLIAWSDTSVEFDALIGAGIVCDARGSLWQLDLLPLSDDEATGTSWSSPAQAGDAVQLWQTSGISPTPEAARARLLRVSGARACALSPLIQSAVAVVPPVQRLILADTLRRAAMVGSPVRVTRRVRLATYQSSDGSWYVGRSTWSAGAWDVIQPIAGPVLPPSALGLRFDVRDSLGTSLRPGGARPAVLHIELRAPRRTTSAARSATAALTDSVEVDLTLRADRSGGPDASG